MNLHLWKFKVVVLLSTAFVITFPHFSLSESLSLGTSWVPSSQYLLGAAIAKKVNKKENDQNIVLQVQPKGGSVYNLNAIESGEFDMGISSIDILNQAYNGKGRFKQKGALKALRSIVTVGSDTFIAISRGDTGIKSFPDPNVKKIGIIGKYPTEKTHLKEVINLRSKENWNFGINHQVIPNANSDSICAGTVDVMLVASSIISQNRINEILSSCDGVIINIAGKNVDELIKQYTHFQPIIIPKGSYKEMDSDIITLGITTSLVSSTRTTDDQIYNVLKSLYDDPDPDFDINLKQNIQNYQQPRLEPMEVGLPVHSGAEKFFKEKGLIPRNPEIEYPMTCVWCCMNNSSCCESCK